MSVRNLAILIAIIATCAAAGAAEPNDHVVHVAGQGVVEIAPDHVMSVTTNVQIDYEMHE